MLRPYPPLKDVYHDNGSVRFDRRWVQLRESFPDGSVHECVEQRKRLQKFVDANHGTWIPFSWPPGYGMTIGDSEYFGVCLDRKTYRRFLCIASAKYVVFVGFICTYGAVPDVRRNAQILVCDKGRTFVYVPTEDRVYMVAESSDGFVNNGISAIYPLYEREFEDDMVNATWYPYSFDGMKQLLSFGRDVVSVLRFADEHGGLRINIGGMGRSSFVFGTEKTVAKGTVHEAVLQGLRQSGLYVFGTVDTSGHIIVLDEQCRAYALMHGAKVVKLSESIRGFLRAGGNWFTFRKRFCFAPLGSADTTISACRVFACEISDYGLPGDNLEAKETRGENTVA